MKISTIKLFFIELILITFLILNIFVINIESTYLFTFILAVFIFTVVLLLGYERNRQRFKKDIILNIIIYTFLFQIILYISGIFLGFLKNAYSLSFTSILKNTIPIFLLIIVSEMLRYCINVKGQNNRLILVLSTVIFILIDITVLVNIGSLINKREIIKIIYMVILPSISKNIMLTYLSVKFGYNVNIIYRMIMELPTYFIPIFPAINDYLNSVLNLLFPIFVMYIIYKDMTKYSINTESARTKKVGKVFAIITTVFAVIVIALTSGIFPLYGLAIGSNSMQTSINRGDVVIVKKVKKDNIKSLKKGDILVYQYKKKVIVHRIIEKGEIDGDITFKTKGDNNKTEDNWIVEEENVIGKTVLKIKYIGYPTVWLNELLNKEE